MFKHGPKPFDSKLSGCFKIVPFLADTKVTVSRYKAKNRNPPCLCLAFQSANSGLELLPSGYGFGPQQS